MAIFAALLAAGGCVALGMQASEGLNKREKLLRDWDGALARMETVIRQGGAPLTEVLRRGAGDSVAPLAALAAEIKTAPAQAPEAFLSRLSWDGLWTPAEKEALAECLEALFSPVPEAQVRALTQARQELALARSAAREKREKNGRLFVSLGWLAGAAAFILLC